MDPVEHGTFQLSHMCYFSVVTCSTATVVTFQLYWQCTGDWGAVAFAAAPLFKRGVA